MNKLYRILFALHAFVGIGAMAGGLEAILNPQNPMGAPLELLEHSPFDNFLIPGILLFGVIGIGNVIAAAAIKFKTKFHGYTSSVFSWALVIWIIVQCIMLNAVGVLHVIFFLIGAVEAALSMSILFKQGLFPTNIIINLYKKISKEM